MQLFPAIAALNRYCNKFLAWSCTFGVQIAAVKTTTALISNAWQIRLSLVEETIQSGKRAAFRLLDTTSESHRLHRQTVEKFAEVERPVIAGSMIVSESSL
jgi:hypothetical protein